MPNGNEKEETTSNSTVVRVVSNGDSDCATEGQVTNVNIFTDIKNGKTGPQGERGETGPPGTSGENAT